MTARFLIGDAMVRLRELADQSVQCVVTSPPYYGLRKYDGTEPSVWADGWVGCLGNEPTPGLYVQHLVAIFRQVRRVLRDDGTVFLNLGDSYAANVPYQVPSTKAPNHVPALGERRVPAGLKPKDLLGIPHTVAFALRSDGWYLRSDIVWAKGVSGQRQAVEQARAAMVEEGVAADVIERVVSRLDPYVGNCMPSSVTDRPTSAHEYVFLLSKSERYYYDHTAVREGFADARQGRDGGKGKSKRNVGGCEDGFTSPAAIDPSANGGRNLRSVWTIPTRPFKGAHFAVMSPDVVEKCVLAGTKPGDITLDPFAGAGTTAFVSVGLGRSSNRDRRKREVHPRDRDAPARGRVSSS